VDSTRDLPFDLRNASSRRPAWLPCNTGAIGSLMIAPQSRASIGARWRKPT